MPRNTDHSASLPVRRRTLAWVACAPWLLTRAARAAGGNALPAVAGVAHPVNVGAAGHARLAQADDPQAQYIRLERAHRRILGLYAVNTGSGRETGHRMHERFPVCSTFKAVLAAAALARGAAHPGWLARRVLYTRQDLNPYSPITGRHLDDGMTVQELCAATVEYSDNTAANLLLRLLGGPRALTAYARSVGNASFRLDRYESEVNTAIPGDRRDTSTPADMGRMLRDLVLGNALPPAGRDHLKTWLKGNTTGDKRIRAGTPDGWRVGDKTGAGDYGTANDIGVVWPPDRPPIVLAIYTTGHDKNDRPDDGLIAAATRLAIAELA